MALQSACIVHNSCHLALVKEVGVDRAQTQTNSCNVFLLQSISSRH